MPRLKVKLKCLKEANTADSSTSSTLQSHSFCHFHFVDALDSSCVVASTYFKIFKHERWPKPRVLALICAGMHAEDTPFGKEIVHDCENTSSRCRPDLPWHDDLTTAMQVLSVFTGCGLVVRWCKVGHQGCPLKYAKLFKDVRFCDMTSIPQLVTTTIHKSTLCRSAGLSSFLQRTEFPGSPPPWRQSSETLRCLKPCLR